MCKRFKKKDIEKYTIHDTEDEDLFYKEEIECSRILAENLKHIKCFNDLGFYCSKELRKLIDCKKENSECKGFNQFWDHNLECKKKIWNKLPASSFIDVFNILKRK